MTGQRKKDFRTPILPDEEPMMDVPEKAIEGRPVPYGQPIFAASLFCNLMFPTLFQVATNTPSNYLPIALQLLVGIGFVVLTLFGSSLLGPKRRTHDKLENFESGIPAVGNARQPMAIKYFLVAILFVLFDVEVIFFYPYAVNFRSLGTEGFMAVVMFVAFFFCGFIYILKKGALKWED